MRLAEYLEKNNLTTRSFARISGINENTLKFYLGDDVKKVHYKTAERFKAFGIYEGDNHKELLKKIRKYSGYLGEGKIPLTDFFITSTYKDDQNKEQPCFEVTRKGCDMIANKMTGAKGTIFTAKYIERFHQMEGVIKKPSSQIELIHMITTEMVNQNQKLNALESDVIELKDNSPMFPLECTSLSRVVRSRGVELMNGKDSNTYQDKSLRTKVYRALYRQLNNEFGVTNYQAIKRKDFEKALKIAKNLNLPFYLKEEVVEKNNQMTLFEGDHND